MNRYWERAHCPQARWVREKLKNCLYGRVIKTSRKKTRKKQRNKEKFKYGLPHNLVEYQFLNQKSSCEKYTSFYIKKVIPVGDKIFDSAIETSFQHYCGSVTSR